MTNKSIISSELSISWKEAKVKPLFKTGAKDDVNNYKSISILPTLSKLIEKWVNNQFSEYLNSFDFCINFRTVSELGILQNLH